MTHTRLLWGGEVQKGFQHSHYQLKALAQWHGGQGRIQARTAGQAEREQGFAVAYEGR